MMDALLESFSPALEIETSHNVYDGLARLCAAGLTGPRAVVVCVDCVGPPEMEFFAILSSVRQGLPVYVYGPEFQEARITRALESGATGRASEDVLRSLVPAAVAVSPPVEEAEAVPEPIRMPDADAGPRPEHEVLDEAETVAPISEVEASVPKPGGKVARVPWMRYEDGPIRTAPPRPAPPDDEDREVGQEDQGTPEPPTHTPLLTDEELRALLEDDIASIAPAEPSDPADDGPVSEEDSL